MQLKTMLQCSFYWQWDIWWYTNHWTHNTGKISYNAFRKHVIVPIAFPSQPPFHIMFLPVPIRLLPYQNILIVWGDSREKLALTTKAFSDISPDCSNLIGMVH